MSRVTKIRVVGVGTLQDQNQGYKVMRVRSMRVMGDGLIRVRNKSVMGVGTE